jgi:ATP-dependent protease ClpP protease subunit
MPIDSSVAELITAQLFVLSQEAPDPIFFYINSTGIAVRAHWTPAEARWALPAAGVKAVINVRAGSAFFSCGLP